MPENSTSPRDLTHTILSVLFIVILIAGSVWVMRPFLMPLIWAAVIVVATWPAFERLEARLGGRHGLAVAVMAAAILRVIIVPITLAMVTIAGSRGVSRRRSARCPRFAAVNRRSGLGGIPLVGAEDHCEWQDLQRRSPRRAHRRSVAPLAKQLAKWLMAKAGGFGLTMLVFLLTVIISAILYANGHLRKETGSSPAFARRLAGSR